MSVQDAPAQGHISCVLSAVEVSMSELSDEELVERSSALVGGLEQIEKRYEEHVFLAWEDPVVFGAGHFVLYPEAGVDYPVRDRGAIHGHRLVRRRADCDFVDVGLAGTSSATRRRLSVGISRAW